VLEFTSARKRMSVIVRCEDGKILLLTKGADTIIEKFLEDSPIKQKTWSHLGTMAQSGLRTLLIAQRIIPEDEYREWLSIYEEATLTFINREEAIERA
jgi:magnesium-transporting ATPase (P-type)